MLSRDLVGPVSEACARIIRSLERDRLAPLTMALKMGSVPGRCGAAGALGKLQSAAAVEPLLEALRDTSAAVRIFAALALGETGSHRFDVRAALELLRGQGDADLAEAADRALDMLIPKPMFD